MSDLLKWTSAPVSSSSIPNTTWLSPQDFPSLYTSAAAPALAVFQDKLWIMHRGGGENMDLWYSNFTPQSGWRNGEWQIRYNNIPVKSPSKPALAVIVEDNTLQCAYLRSSGQTQRGGHISFVSTDNGQDWNPPVTEHILPSASGPAVAWFRDAFWCVFRQLESNQLWVALLYGMEVDSYEISSQKSSAAPALAVFKDQLWCVYRGYGNDNNLYVTTSNRGEIWAPPTPIPGQTSDCEPALVYVSENDALLCVYGDGNGGSVFYYTYNTTGDPTKWSSPKTINGNPRAPGTGVGLAEYQKNIYCVYRTA
ncbi:hypothetical protein DUT91_02260 [Phyllobacterium salinisoli]|uniref:Exo-alpha-sialidase n=1 Tax=Phyllobacterium salinisoli TaxID=1899321 RepID=A0A368K8D9_9HYPH|nr:hypothetical protein [Phyllobacterium salinisoli]RCS25628.1 hypothetical protein DUT91_02260 [Phyllobacterium salinisoli]